MAELSTDSANPVAAEPLDRVGFGPMDDIRLTRDLAAAGFDFTEVDRMRRRGELRRIRRGAYEDGNREMGEPVEQHRRLIDATLRQASVNAVVSHMSAAALHGLPTWNDQLSRVHLTRNRASGGKVRRYTHLHVAPLADDDICVVDGVAVTTLARTILDLSRTLSMERSVPIGDAALALGLSREELVESALRAVGWPGIAAARRAIEFFDARSESVGESYSRVVFHRLLLPPPELQFEVFTNGRLVARSDFVWKESKTLGEFDGRVKYGRLLKPGQTTGDVIFDEKVREDALRDLGWQIVRWLWEDLRNPARLRERLERAFLRGSRVA